MASSSRKKRRPLRTLALLLLAAAAFALFLRWENTALKTTHFDPVFQDLPAGFDGCKIVVLSDLHGAVFGQDNQDLFAAVAAESPDIAKKAVNLIKVEYEALPVITDGEEAIKPEAWPIHEGGNIVGTSRAEAGG